WEKDDVSPRAGDLFQERLYCVRWIDPSSGERHYRSVTEGDLERERRVLELLKDRMPGWQAAGYLPSSSIESGRKTGDPIGMRGWAYWHQLFNPRQLLVNGLIACLSDQLAHGDLEQTGLLLSGARAADWNSRLCR